MTELVWFVIGFTVTLIVVFAADIVTEAITTSK